MCFDPSGRWLIAADPEGVSLIDVTHHKTTRLPFANTRAAACFSDQVWLVADDVLVRSDFAGEKHAETLLRFATRGALEPAPCGPPAAVWSAIPPVVLVAEDDRLVELEPADADVVMPLTGRRHVVARGSRVTMPSGISLQLAPGSTVLAGAAMADGRSVVLHVAHGRNRHVVMVSLGAGQIIRRYAAIGGNLRLANRGGLALLLDGPRRLWAVSLIAGRELGEIELDRDVAEIAIDHDGHVVALRDIAGGVEVRSFADVIARPVAVSVPPAPEPESTTACEVVVQHTPPAPQREPLVCPTLPGLAPRARPPEIDPQLARSQLDRELRLVALFTLQAIAGAWDTRRIGYGDEGHHPFEHEVAAILGMNRGFAGEYVEAARTQLEAHKRAIENDRSWRAANTPVGALIAEHALSDRAVDVLLVIAAASLWGDIARLFGILSNDAVRSQVDELVVQHVLAARHGRHDVAAELDPRAPLIRLGIVRVSTKRARPFADLAIEPVVLDRLRAIEPALGAATTLRRSSAPLDQLDISRDVLERALATFGAADRIAIRGRDGHGRRTLLATLAGAAGRDLAVIDATALSRTAESFSADLRSALRRAHLSGLIPCISGLHEVTFGEDIGSELAAEVIREHPGPITVVAPIETAIPFDHGHVAIELPLLPELERCAVWSRVVASAGLVADTEALASRYRLGPGAIRRMVDSARGRATDDATGVLDALITQARDARLMQYARRVDRVAAWSNVVLPPDILDSLRELVARVRFRRTVFEIWGMGRAVATARGLTALFQGQPGTGKTLVAGVIARELGLELYQVDLSKVMSKWIGETERNLATIFDAAEDGQVVLLFDEADSLFAKRTEVRSSNDRYANLEVNFLLQRLDAFEGIAILTTNNGGTIDPAFKRRLSFQLSFPFPDEETRERLWRAHLPPELPTVGALGLDVLAHKYQLSGGYIRNACLRAAFLAAQDETALRRHHLERAVTLEFAELGKLSTGGTID